MCLLGLKLKAQTCVNIVDKGIWEGWGLSRISESGFGELFRGNPLPLVKLWVDWDYIGLLASRSRGSRREVWILEDRYPEFRN